jgi:hypothetical protein
MNVYHNVSKAMNDDSIARHQIRRMMNDQYYINLALTPHAIAAGFDPNRIGDIAPYLTKPIDNKSEVSTGNFDWFEKIPIVGKIFTYMFARIFGSSSNRDTLLAINFENEGSTLEKTLTE